jgi:hypothetical protein
MNRRCCLGQSRAPPWLSCAPQHAGQQQQQARTPLLHHVLRLPHGHRCWLLIVVVVVVGHCDWSLSWLVVVVLVMVVVVLWSWSWSWSWSVAVTVGRGRGRAVLHDPHGREELQWHGKQNRKRIEELHRLSEA